MICQQTFIKASDRRRCWKGTFCERPWYISCAPTTYWANGTRHCDDFTSSHVSSTGREHNFNTYNDTTSSSLGVPYDYGSMMHYSKNAFRNGTEPTIVTKIPAFSDVIGQRMEFSDSDLLKLHRLYNCSKRCVSLIHRCWLIHFNYVDDTGQ